MNIDEIFAEWEIDSNINSANLDNEALKIPKLHNKYYKILSSERLKLRKLEAEFAILKKIKIDYYLGILDQETMLERKYKPFRMKVIKQDIPVYLEADQELIQFNLKISVIKEKIEILDSIIRIIGNRGFHIKSAIDFLKYKAGEF